MWNNFTFHPKVRCTSKRSLYSQSCTKMSLFSITQSFVKRSFEILMKLNCAQNFNPICLFVRKWSCKRTYSSSVIHFFSTKKEEEETYRERKLNKHAYWSFVVLDEFPFVDHFVWIDLTFSYVEEIIGDFFWMNFWLKKLNLNSNEYHCDHHDW